MIALTSSGQILVQAIGMVSGILIVRLLPVHEYALYTLANSVLGAMAILADGGIASAVMAQGGKVWSDRAKAGGVLAAGIGLRKKFAVISLVIALPSMVYLLRMHQATWLMTVLISLSLVMAFVAALFGNLLEIFPKLHQDIQPIQAYQIQANVGRLILSGILIFAFPFAAVAICIGALAQAWNNWRLRKISAKYVDMAPIDIAAKAEIVAVVRRVMPSAVYYCISGQITIWLVSLMGTTENVAQLGAIGRLVIVISVLSAVFSYLIVPRYAKLPAYRQILLSKLFQIQAALLFTTAAVMGATYFSADAVLWVLGQSYTGLRNELLLAMAAGCISLLYGSTFMLCINRGWIVPPAVNIGVSLVSQIGFLGILGFDSLRQILIFSISVGTVQYAMWVSYIYFRIIEIDAIEEG